MKLQVIIKKEIKDVFRMCWKVYVGGKVRESQLKCIVLESVSNDFTDVVLSVCMPNGVFGVEVAANYGGRAIEKVQ